MLSRAHIPERHLADVRRIQQSCDAFAGSRRRFSAVLGQSPTLAVAKKPVLLPWKHVWKRSRRRRFVSALIFLSFCGALILQRFPENFLFVFDLMFAAVVAGRIKYAL